MDSYTLQLQTTTAPAKVIFRGLHFMNARTVFLLCTSGILWLPYRNEEPAGSMQTFMFVVGVLMRREHLKRVLLFFLLGLLLGGLFGAFLISAPPIGGLSSRIQGHSTNLL